MGTIQRGISGLNTATPDLSIIVGCFNQGEVLESALRDCFRAVNGLVDSFETIIINDGSTDGSVRILDRLRKEFPHVRVTHQLHSGRAKAVRRGYDLARGEYLFQVDLSQPQWVSDFALFWNSRDRYSVILGHHPHRGGRVQRALHWLQTKWIKLWFGAELIEPDANYRLCRRAVALQYLQLIPKDYEGLNLALTLSAFRDSPRQLLEIEVGTGSKPPAFSFTEHTGKIIRDFIEIVGLRLKKKGPFQLSPASQTI